MKSNRIMPADKSRSLKGRYQAALNKKLGRPANAPLGRPSQTIPPGAVE